MGGDPLDPDQIAFVYEGQGSPRVMPTLPVVLVPSNTHSLGLDMTRVLHGEQRLTLHAALAPEGDVISDTRTHSIIDKRSEEHTSELQSLMRISYAVFCLKQKKQ